MRLLAQIVMIKRAIKSPLFASSLLASCVDLAFGRGARSSWIMLILLPSVYVKICNFPVKNCNTY
jgi:hypothetical protein